MTSTMCSRPLGSITTAVRMPWRVKDPFWMRDDDLFAVGEDDRERTERRGANDFLQILGSHPPSPFGACTATYSITS